MSIVSSERVLRLKERISERALERKKYWEQGRQVPPGWLKKEVFALAYVKYSNLPHPVRFAKTLADVWLSSPVNIEPEEMIAGSCSLVQSIGYDYARGIIVKKDIPGELPDDELRAVRYFQENFNNYISEYGEIVSAEYLEKKNFQHPPFCLAAFGGGTSHLSFNFDFILKYGLIGIEKKIRTARKAYRGDQKKMDFLEAETILLDGISRLSSNYSHKALELSREEKNNKRRKELLQISDICSRVPWQPARNFYEALQSVWFIYLLDGFANGIKGEFGRFDQYMLPYYKKSVNAGEITAQEAQEMIDLLWVKINTEGAGRTITLQGPVAAGSDVLANLCLAGLTPDGDDACNELTEMCLSAVDRLALRIPNVSFRWSPKTPPEVWLSAVRILAKGRALPALYSDAVVVPALVKIGVTENDARDYTTGGCNNIHITGKSHFGCPDVDKFNVVKPLEWTLFNGHCLYHNEQEGLTTGEVNCYKDFSELLASYKQQLAHGIKWCAEACNILQEHRSYNFPHLYKSLFVDGCLEKGCVIDSGSAKYNGGMFWLIGFANAGDSLAALRKAVFEEKIISLTELCRVLKNNFLGCENLQAYLKNKCPKFGNNDPYADDLTAEIAAFCFAELKKIPAWRGGFYSGQVTTLFRNIELGRLLSATPDGRMAGEQLCSSIGPADGNDRNGATAMLNSALKIPQDEVPGGVILNMRFIKDEIQEHDKIQKLADLFKAYFLNGGQEVQVTVVNDQELRAAKVNPEKYADLYVKVGGYVARFIDLSAEEQDSIIRRTELNI